MNDISVFQEAIQQRNEWATINKMKMDAIFEDRNTELVDQYHLQNSFPVNFQNGILNNVKPQQSNNIPEAINNNTRFDLLSDIENDTVYVIPERYNLNSEKFKIDPLLSEMNPTSRKLRECQRSFKDQETFLARTDLHQDACKQDYREAQSVYGGNYQLADYSRFRENKTKTLDITYNNPTSHFREGYNPGSCQIAVDSYLKQRPELITSSRNRKELPSFHVNAPNKEFGSGTIPPEEPYRNTEHFLQKNPILHQRTPYNEKYDPNCVRVEFSRYIEPQLPNIAENIQKPSNLIQELAQPDFIRGGYLTRSWLQDQVITYNFNRLDGTPYKSRPNC